MWVELIPTEDCTAETVIKALFDNVVSRFGLPRGISLLTDNGSGFIARLTTHFCKVFGIKQYFTTPYHAQTNSRAEQFADTIHKSLRLLTDNQTEWADHLQAVAMAYRATPNTNLALSPYEVVFGQKMTLALDWSLLAEDSTTGSPQAYAEMIRPKLQLLHYIAMENAADSAVRHARTHNESAAVPPYAAGDKVLLFNPATKKNESAKLKRRYLGPYLITDCLPGYNYTLKELSTGKEMRRPVHANRLRPVKELNNDYRLNTGNTDVTIYEGKTIHRQLDVSVKVGSIVHARVDVIVNPANPQLQHDAGAAAAIARAAGDTLISECSDYVRAQGPLEVAEPLMTTSGKLRPHIKAVLHVAGPNVNEEPFKGDPILAQGKLREAFYNCLTLVDHLPNFTSIAFPAISAGLYGMDGWSVSHAAVEAVKQFDADTQSVPGSLRQIEFIMLSLTLADMVSAVCREELTSTTAIDFGATPTTGIPTDVVPPDDAAGDNKTTESETTNTGEWFAIDRLLRHRRQRGKDLYLVKWIDSEILSWVERSNITDGALQHFYANRKRRKRRRS
jgi:O-acetyl-ADP-ribose deacetylase (regulator of RNase III)